MLLKHQGMNLGKKKILRIDDISQPLANIGELVRCSHVARFQAKILFKLVHSYRRSVLPPRPGELKRFGDEPRGRKCIVRVIS